MALFFLSLIFLIIIMMIINVFGVCRSPSTLLKVSVLAQMTGDTGTAVSCYGFRKYCLCLTSYCMADQSYSCKQN